MVSMYKSPLVVLATLAVAFGTDPGDAPGLLCSTTDTVFLIDSSQSITKEQFDKIKEYAVTFVKHFEIGTAVRQSQFAVIIFNEAKAFSWPLNKYTNKDALIDAINKLPYHTGTTDTGTAFKEARSIITGEGSRRGSCRGVVLFTDGRYDKGENPVPIAQAIRQQLEATVISVAVEGINGFLAPFDQQILIDIAGDKNHFFELNTLLNQQK